MDERDHEKLGDHDPSRGWYGWGSPRWYGWESPIGLGLFVLLLAVSAALIRFAFR
ncbi:MAG TPA: hypothetical protein VFD49_19455 [Candidatus Dormibacteraeota bacterium]|nr:hypothetical protein [Candidatus Dormibacteraeota bacterium]